jgi:hypothetical protein
MVSNEGTKQDPGKPDPVARAGAEDPYPNPIVISSGGGSYLRLQVPETVVERLGGSPRLRERLNTILASEPYESGQISPQVAAELTTHYDEFLQQLEAMSVDLPPTHADPKERWERWSITVPIPGTVLEELGGASRLHERLTSIPLAASHRYAEASPHAAVRLTARYDKLLGGIETIIGGPGR